MVKDKSSRIYIITVKPLKTLKFDLKFMPKVYFIFKYLIFKYYFIIILKDIRDY